MPLFAVVAGMRSQCNKKYLAVWELLDDIRSLEKCLEVQKA
ncbi:hypothetical protein [Brunnivagina elsteri]|nr:hypothetical protein [Calothrix elsteri]